MEEWKREGKADSILLTHSLWNGNQMKKYLS